jgi:ATP-dependent Clp protease ATP-binding subunit ClpX
MSVLKLAPKKRDPLYCSFCGKEKDEVVYLVAGSTTVFICNECVELCREVGTKTVLENLPNVTEAEGRAMATGEATPRKK